MQFLTAVLLLLILLFVLLLPVIIVGVIWVLAQINVLFSDVKEGQAKVHLYNKKFKGCFMSYSGHKFRGDNQFREGEVDEHRGYIISDTKPTDADTNPVWEKFTVQKIHKSGERRGETYSGTGYRRSETDEEVREHFEPHPWDVVRLLPGETEDNSPLSQIPIFGGFLSNIYWIGIWPFGQIHTYKMRWVSWDYPHTDTSVTSAEKQPIPHQEEIDYVLVQEDVYWVKIPKAETREGIPVDLNLLLTLASCNPYKSLFKVERWVEATTNQAEADGREFVGLLKFENLFGDKTATAEMLNENALQELRRFRSQYGINAKLVQIQSLDPAGERGEQYRELSTKKYEAEQLAKARKIEGIGEKSYIQDTKGTEAEIEKGLHTTLGKDSYKALKMGQGSLTTYVEGGGQAMVAVPASKDGSDQNKTKQSSSKSNRK